MSRPTCEVQSLDPSNRRLFEYAVGQLKSDQVNLSSQKSGTHLLMLSDLVSRMRSNAMESSWLNQRCGVFEMLFSKFDVEKALKELVDELAMRTINVTIQIVGGAAVAMKNRVSARQRVLTIHLLCLE